jgi:tape measure domain-containing protein
VSNLGYATVTLMPSAKGFGAAMNSQVSSAAGSAGKSGGAKAGGSFVKSFGGGIVKVGAIATGVVGVVGGAIGAMALGKGLDRALDIQSAQKKLEGLGHSQAGIAEIMANALSSVKGTAFGLGDAATVAASAVAAGVKPGKDLAAYLKLTADTATIAGTDIGSMGSILNKTTASGVVYTDTLNQLSDRGVPVFQFLAKSMGVSQEALAKMVSDGKVKASDLRKALEDNLAGAALQSGATATGAWANVGAALGRLGAQFETGPVNAAPALFQTMAGGVDGFASSIKPLSDLVSGLLVSAMGDLQTKLAAVDWDAFSAKVRGVVAAMREFLAGFKSPPNPLALKGGDQVSGPLTNAAKVGMTARGVFEKIRAAVADIGPAVKGVFSGKGLDLSGFTGSLGQIRDVLNPMFPLFVAVAHAVGGVATNLGGALGASVGIINPLLKVLVGILQFVASHMDVIVPLLPVIAAGFVAWRVATTSVLAANRLLTAAEIAALPVRVLNNAARVLAARAELQVAAANGTSTGSIVANGLATARQTIATVAGRIATVAAAGAAKAAAAGQWLLNAAMSANPIGLVVAAIAVLVAGLVWFFTQTKLGQAIWANFTKFLGEAWANIVAVGTAVFTGLAAFFSQTWTGIVGFVSEAVANVKAVIALVFGAISAFFRVEVAIWSTVIGAVWSAIKAVVTAGVNGVKSVISTVFSTISGVFRTGVAIWSAVISTAWSAIKAVVSAGINIVKTVISTALAVIKAVFSGNWGAIPGIISGALGKIGGILRGLGSTMVGIVGGFGAKIQAAFGNAGSILLNAGKQVIGGLLDGLRSVVGNVTSFFTDLTSKIPDWKGPAATDKTLLTPAGQMIMGSLIGGLKTGEGPVKGYLTAFTSSISPAVLDHLDSKAFEPVGKLIGKGIAVGIDESQSDIASSMTGLADKIKSSFETLATEQSAAVAKAKQGAKDLKGDKADLSLLQKRLTDVNPKSKTADTQRKSILQRIKAKQAEIKVDGKAKKSGNATAASDAYAINFAGGQKALQKFIATQSATLDGLAATRYQVTKDLKNANDALVGQIKIRDDFKAAVAGAVVDLGNVADAFAAAVDARTDAANKVTDLTKNLSDLSKDFASADKDAAGLAQDAAALDRDEAGLGRDKQTILDKIAAQMVLTGSTNESKRSAALDKISDLQDSLLDIDAKYADLADKRDDLASKGADIAAKRAETEAQRSALASQIVDQSTKANASVTDAIKGNLAKQINDTRGFYLALNTLRSQGLDDSSYQQILAKGVQGGGLATAQAFLAAGPGYVHEIAGLQKDLAAAGDMLGSSTSNSLYQSGVDAAQGLVNGLQSQQDAITKQMETIANALVDAINKRLDIHSPSRVLRKTGQNTGLGMALGLEDTAGDIAKSSEALVPTMPSVATPRFGTSVVGALSTAQPSGAPLIGQVTAYGYTADEVADRVATKTRRALRRVTIPKVSVA